MKCLIVGDARFIASEVAEELLEGDCEVALVDDHPLPKSIANDVQSISGNEDSMSFVESEIKAFSPDIAIHLSAKTREHAKAFCKVVDKLAAHLVVASSINVYKANSRVYGPSASDFVEETPINEEAPLREKPLIADSDGDKKEVEEVIQRSPVTSTLLRLPPIYGPGDPYRRLYPLLIRLFDDRPFIAVSESQANWRWTHGYSKDIAHGIALAALTPGESNRVYNLGESNTPSIVERISHFGTVLEWEGKLAALPDQELPEYLVARGNFSQDLAFDTSKIRSELGYKEKGDYYDGLFDSIEWYRDNPPAAYAGKRLNYSAEDALRDLIASAERKN